MIISTLLTLLSGLILWYYWRMKWNNAAKALNSIPNPPTVPLFGNLFNLSLPPDKLWLVARDYHQKYFPRFKLTGYKIRVILTCDPDDVEAVLRSQKYIYKGKIYTFFKPFLSDGLFTTNIGEKWHARRKMLTPSFHFNILREFLVSIIDETKRMTTNLKETEEPIIKNLMELFGKHVLNIICATAMGTHLKNTNDSDLKYREAIAKMSNIITYRIVRPWYYPDFIFNLTSKGREQKRLVNAIQNFTRNVIQERKKYHDVTNRIYLENTNNHNTNDGDLQRDKDIHGVRKRKLAMLDLLIAAQYDGNNIDDEGIREEVDTFMFAGFDTTSTALGFLFFLLAQHAEIQDRIRTEINEIFSKYEGNLTMSAIQDMQYLEACIKESLRLYPSAPYISRHLREDVQLKKHLLPAASDVYISIFEVHRNPKHWPNPDVFNPDRFLPENCKGRHPFAYIPFSAGPRNCIGQKLAMMIMKVLTFSLLKNFFVIPVNNFEDVQIIGNLILTPSRPVYVRFIPIL